MRSGLGLWALAVVAACGGDPRGGISDAATTTTRGAPEVSDPLRQGFTQRPAPDTPGLPPPIPPLLTSEELERARSKRETWSDSDLERAQRELRAAVEVFEAEPSGVAIARLRESATALAKEGRVHHITIAKLYSEYLFPNPESEADSRYKGKFVVVTGTVAPANMKDFADGFKLIEQNPYIHDPLLLATDYELSFVECRLAHAAFQELRDWQPIHFVAEVQGKRTSDVLLGRCVVL